MTGDATIKPNDDHPISVQCVIGGTIGTPGIFLRYSFSALSIGADDRDWSCPIALGSGTSLTIVEPYFTCKFNFSAGTLGTYWLAQLTTSGTRQQLLLNSAVIASGVNYLHRLTFDSAAGPNNVRLNVSPMGQAALADVTGTATGVVLQKPWEETILGSAVNGAAREGYEDQPPAKGYFGGIRFSKAVTATANPVPTTLPGTPNASGQILHFQPRTGTQNILGIIWPTQLLDGDGITVAGWFGQVTPARWTSIRVRRGVNDTTAFTSAAEIVNGGFDGGSFRSLSGILAVSCINDFIDNMIFRHLWDGLQTLGSTFGSNYGNMAFACTQISLSATNGGAQLHGAIWFDGGAIMFLSQASAWAGDASLFLNTEPSSATPGATILPIILSQVAFTTKLTFIVDDENFGPSNDVPREQIRASILSGQSLELNGSIGSGAIKTTPLKVGGFAGTGKIVLENITLAAPSTVGASVVALRPDSPIIECTAGMRQSVLAGTPPLSSGYRGIVRPFGGALPPGPDLTSTNNETLIWSEATKVRRMQPGTITSATNKNLDPSAMNEGDKWYFPIEAQSGSGALTFTDLSNGGLSWTRPVGYIGTLVLRYNRKNLELSA